MDVSTLNGPTKSYLPALLSWSGHGTKSELSSESLMDLNISERQFELIWHILCYLMLSYVIYYAIF